LSETCNKEKAMTDPTIICLSEKQQTAVLNATQPLDPYQREAFMIALVQLLAGRTAVGDGQLYRMIRELQRIHFVPPDIRGDYPAQRGRP
jgi:hypothetical protein